MIAKRTLDLFGSACALLLLAPFFALIAIWIALDSPGPVLFRQTRVGRYDVPFYILKFRTMHCGGECSSQLTVGIDARVTRAGQFLRRVKLDELPQLWNVLRGEMSLVGPRPEVPRYVAHYPSRVRALVLSVAPGITDWASISYKDESTLLGSAIDPERAYIETVLPIKLAYYVRYVRERGFWSDLHIIGATLLALLRR